MARRLLGADSATVFNVQEPEEEAANQVCDPPGFPGEQSVLRPPPPASLGTWSWASSVQNQGWVTGSLWPAASEHALCWGVMELFQSMTPVLFVLSISFSSSKYLSDFPVLCYNAQQVFVEEMHSLRLC